MINEINKNLQENIQEFKKAAYIEKVKTNTKYETKLIKNRNIDRVSDNVKKYVKNLTQNHTVTETSPPSCKYGN